MTTVAHGSVPDPVSEGADEGGSDRSRSGDGATSVDPRLARLVLALFCGAFLWLGLIQAARDSPTVDEAVDVTAGLVAAEHRDLRMNPEHGLLHHLAPGILSAAVADPLVPRTAAFEEGDWFDYTDDLIAANDAAGRLDDVLFWFRVVPLVAGAATGVLLYILARRLSSPLGGLVAAALWLGTPYVLGLAHLSSLDVSYAFVVVLFACALERYVGRPSSRPLIGMALALGLALLVRHSAVVLVPAAAVSVALTARRRTRRELLTALALVLLVPVAVVWAAHRAVDPSGLDGPPRDRFEGMIAAASNSGPLERLSLAVPMPVEWKAGFAYLALTSEERPSQALGRSFEGHPIWYLPANGLIKFPLVVTVTLLSGLAGWMGSDARRARTARLGHVAAVVGILAGFLLWQPLALGLRLALPVFALATIAGAGLVFLRRSVAVAIAVALIGGLAAASAMAHPSSLAWTPPPFSDGYRLLSDSSIDFAQANSAVRKEHEEAPFTAVELLAPRGYEVLPGVPSLIALEPSDVVGRVAVSSTVLSIMAAEELAWLRVYCPVDVIGRAVLVYEFTEPPRRDVAQAVPAAPCDSPPSRPD